MDLPLMADSIDLSAVCGQLQFFRSMQLSFSLLAVMLHMTDSLIKFQFEKFTQTVAEVSTVFLLELICLRLQASLIFDIFPRSASVGAC